MIIFHENLITRMVLPSGRLLLAFALFGPIRETFGSFMAISRKMFTSEADCYVSLSMTTLVMLNSKYAFFKVGSDNLFHIRLSLICNM